MKILVDSSVWIDYFRKGENSAILDQYIDANIIFTNDLILAEIIPALLIRNQNFLVDLLSEISKARLTINWGRIIEFQTICLKNGINKVSIPDLIIADNAIEYDLVLFTLDKHFKLLKDYINIKLLN